ncbi:MAG: TOBE domain-containing protein, partial [Bosea sp. (in: a-proteobacteria)]
EAGSVLDGEVMERDEGFGLTTLRTAAGLLQVLGPTRTRGGRLRVRILARDVMLSLVPPQGLSALNIFKGTVSEIGARDGHGAVLLRLDCQGAPLLCRVTAKSVAMLGLAPGAPVHAIVKSVSVETP